MALQFLYTGHNYSNNSTTLYNQWITQTDAISLPPSMSTGLPGRFANTMSVIPSDSSAYTTGPYFTKGFLLQNDKKVFIAIDYSPINRYDYYDSRYVLALSNGTITDDDGVSPFTASTNAAYYFTLVINLQGKLELRNSVLGLFATGNIYLCNNVFYRISIECTLDTTGEIKVYVNDTLDINFSGNTTNNITTGQYRLRYGFYNARYGTIALWDTKNNGNNGFTQFVNDFAPIQILPDGPGSSTQGTPVGTANNWQAVDETFRNGTTDYVTLNANTTQKDLYSYSNITATGNVITIATIPAAWLGNTANVGLAKISFTTSSNGSNGNSAFSAPLKYLGNTTYGYAFGVLEISNDPNTGNAWTIDAINNAQFGVLAK